MSHTSYDGTGRLWQGSVDPGVVAAERDNAALPNATGTGSWSFPRQGQLLLPRGTTLLSWLDAAAISTGRVLRPIKKGNRPPPPLHGS